jgi:hypothetical protein
MFGWFRKKPDARATYILCVEAIKATWTKLDHRETSTPTELAAELESLAGPAFRFMYKHFPLSKEAPPSLVWRAIFTAVLESKTHSPDDVNKAIDLLRAKYID